DRGIQVDRPRGDRRNLDLGPIDPHPHDRSLPVCLLDLGDGDVQGFLFVFADFQGHHAVLGWMGFGARGEPPRRPRAPNKLRRMWGGRKQLPPPGKDVSNRRSGSPVRETMPLPTSAERHEGVRWFSGYRRPGGASDYPIERLATSRITLTAVSMASSSTSRWVTARSRCGPNAVMSTPCSRRVSARRSAGPRSGATSIMTMLVSGGSTSRPSMASIPAARRAARRWSSARRWRLWRSAYSPAAASKPTCRIPPP